MFQDSANTDGGSGELENVDPAWPDADDSWTVGLATEPGDKAG